MASIIIIISDNDYDFFLDNDYHFISGDDNENNDHDNLIW